jgi:hypothetical protein
MVTWVLLLYDRHPGGIGLATQVELLFGELLVAAASGGAPRMSRW